MTHSPAVAAEGLLAVVERQRMFSYPDDGQAEVCLKPDLALRRARKIMSDMLRDEQRSAQQTVE